MRGGVLFIASAVLLGGCAGPVAPDIRDTPLHVQDEVVVAVLAWSNDTISGRFTGYGLFPVAAGALEETVYDVVVPVNATLLRLHLEASPDNAEFYVADPRCPSTPAECRSEHGFVGGDYSTWESPDPQAGTWRFELAGSGIAFAGEVRFTMDIAIAAAS